MKEYKLSNGEKFWYVNNGHIFFEKNGKIDYNSPQTLALDYLDYRYTHGGKLYQEACEIIWRDQNV